MQAVEHSWKAYETYAWGYDELMPLNKSGRNSFGGLGATIIDSLDTLHMLGMTAEFTKCGEPPTFASSFRQTECLSSLLMCSWLLLCSWLCCRSETSAGAWVG